MQIFFSPRKLFLFLNILFPASSLFLLFLFRNMLLLLLILSSFMLPPCSYYWLLPLLFFFVILYYIPASSSSIFLSYFCFPFLIICISLLSVSFFTVSVLSAHFIPLYLFSFHLYVYFCFFCFLTHACDVPSAAHTVPCIDIKFCFTVFPILTGLFAE